MNLQQVNEAIEKYPYHKCHDVYSSVAYNYDTGRSNWIMMYREFESSQMAYTIYTDSPPYSQKVPAGGVCRVLGKTHSLSELEDIKQDLLNETQSGCINPLGCACEQANGHPLTDCTYFE